MNDQFLYLGRWVKKDNFRAFVYNELGEKLANSYDEYQKLIESGLWFTEKEGKLKKTRKSKNGTDS